MLTLIPYCDAGTGCLIGTTSTAFFLITNITFIFAQLFFRDCRNFTFEKAIRFY